MDATLARIVKLAQQQRDIEASIAKAEEDLKTLNKNRERIAGGHLCEGELPLAMQEAELTEFKMEDGTIITVAEELQPPSMAAKSADREPMLKWLDANSLGDAIKNSITILFTKGDKNVPIIKAELDKLKVAYEDFATIHPSTLKALLKELLEKGDELPMEDLNIKMFRQSKVK